MDLSIKVQNKKLIICQLILLYNEDIVAMTFDMNVDAQSFYDTKAIALELENAYFSKGSFSFSETSSNTDAGLLFDQKINFSFPSNENRAERIDKFRQVRFIILKLNDGRKMILGRNDFNQNARIRPTFDNNLNTTEVYYKFQSIFPASFIYD